MTPLHPKANRQAQISRANAIISKGANLLILGTAGLGKTSFLLELFEQRDTCEISLLITHSTIRRSLIVIAEAIHVKHGLFLDDKLLTAAVKKKYRMQGFLSWQDIKYGLSRHTIETLLTTIKNSLAQANCRIALFIDDLPTAPTQIGFYKRLLTSCQIIATATPQKLKGDSLLFSYQLTNKITLVPLSNEASKDIATKWIESHEVRFDNNRAKQLLIKHIANVSHGNPSAILSMLHAISINDSISVKHVKMLQNESGRTIDMTPALFLFVLGAMAARHIYRGIGEMELQIFSIIIATLAMLLLYLWRYSNKIK